MSRQGWLAALALSGTLGCAHAQLADIDAESLALEDTQGATIRLSAYHGQVVLVGFFATWCFFCLADVPRFQALQDAHGAEGLQVIGVGLDLDGKKVLEPFRAFYHLTYPVLIGADRFGREGLPFAPVTTLPTAYVVGRDGKVLARWEGVIPDKVLQRVIENALKR